MNILCIDQLIVMARIGVHNWEKQCLQKLVFDFQISFDNIYCVNNIKESAYLDYDQINQIVCNTVKKEHFLLIEDVAEVLSKKLINNFCIISKVQIKVNKPGAICNAQNVGIYIERSRINTLKKAQLYTGWQY